jgi:hypothetical protein
MPGNERLQPIVTALPVSPPSPPVDKEGKVIKASSGCPPLMLIGGEMIGLRSHFRREWAGLYNNPAIGPIRITAGVILVAGSVTALILQGTGNHFPALAMFLCVTIGHVILELVMSTIFLERKGWMFLSDSEWGGDAESFRQRLEYLDGNLGKLIPWGTDLRNYQYKDRTDLIV